MNEVPAPAPFSAAYWENQATKLLGQLEATTEENERRRRLIDRLTGADSAGRPFPYRAVRYPEGQECVWCGAWQEGHAAGCPWVEARALLAGHAP